MMIAFILVNDFYTFFVAANKLMMELIYDCK